MEVAIKAWPVGHRAAASEHCMGKVGETVAEELHPSTASGLGHKKHLELAPKGSLSNLEHIEHWLLH
jgi:hypothetical protein